MNQRIVRIANGDTNPSEIGPSEERIKPSAPLVAGAGDDSREPFFRMSPEDGDGRAVKVKRPAAGGTPLDTGDGLAILTEPDNSIRQGPQFGVGSRLLAEPLRRLVALIKV